MTKRPFFAAGLCAVLAALPLAGYSAQSPSDFALVEKLNETFVHVAEKSSSTVVVINVIQRVSFEEEDSDSFGELPPGLKKFHEQFKRPDKARGEGSGVIIRSNGYILTNRHVVEDAESIEVHLQDGRNFKAALRGMDPQS